MVEQAGEGYLRGRLEGLDLPGDSFGHVALEGLGGAVEAVRAQAVLHQPAPTLIILQCLRPGHTQMLLVSSDCVAGMIILLITAVNVTSLGSNIERAYC